MTLSIKVPSVAGKFTRNLAGLYDRVNLAVTRAANIVASMIEASARADIIASGNFSNRWSSGLHVTVEGSAPANMRISMHHDIPFADIFETGGQIQGNPFLWIPISGTDAEGVRARDYGGLFSAKYPRESGPPLLFAIGDRMPRYFGASQVTLSKRWDLSGDMQRGANEFATVFRQEFKNA